MVLSETEAKQVKNNSEKDSDEEVEEVEFCAH